MLAPGLRRVTTRRGRQAGRRLAVAAFFQNGAQAIEDLGYHRTH
jgi:hypothetical protein